MIFFFFFSKNKNLSYALEVLSKVKNEVRFDIYGPKEDMIYWKQCEKLIVKMPGNIEINYKYSLKPDEIVETMRQYHAFFLPTKSENFGHVIVEAMQSGVVPIISNQTPWRNLSKSKAGWDLDLCNINAFSEVIDNLYEMNSDEYNQWSQGAMLYVRSKLNIDRLKEKYIEMFKSAVNKT